MRVIAIVVLLALIVPVVASTAIAIFGSGDKIENLVEVPQRGAIAPFGTASFRVNGNPTEYCALLAATSEAHQQGMQQRRDLGGFDAMIFAFDEDNSVSFINHFVPVDLDIGWYDRNGVLVDFTSMDKCPDGVNCPTYAARSVYRYAVETLTGGLAGLGLTQAGATLSVGGGC